ncbi:Dpy-30 motif family protein [Tritrichomonas foetus]|uniref:Dpy-30 motif family protein n=1 Tax=Tritrichomonas foetus TaxID=1144522 RepID=A0A1J4K221_9EUKA|nr:Dpy-30 motif family protein [Tritrichomonas foetus]|eukprot:OHT05283.1 Dpy-30 motif family protein [Tritrichomonas foetus]
MEEEEERQPSDYKVFVDNCDQYIGSAVSRFLAKKGFTVFGYGKSAPHKAIQLVSSRKEGILSTELSVFEMIEDTSAVTEALEIVNSNPLHRKISMVIFSPLLTWGGRVIPKEEEEDQKESPQDNENEEGNEEEDEDDGEPDQPITEEEYLNRVPHEIVKEQYRLESRALQLNEELERLRVFIFGVGLLYGLGENMLFPFFRALWEKKADCFPACKSHISCMHVENLGLVVKQLLEQPPEDGEDAHPPYYILSEAGCPSLRAIGRAFSKVLSDGKTCELTDPIPELHKLILTTELASESTFLQDVEAEDLHCGEGIIESAAKVVDEFRAKNHLEPLKVLVIGPPASGYTEVAQRISEKIGAPFVDPIQLVEEAKKETSEFGDEIRTMIEENENVVTDEIICKVAHKRMAQRDCRNYGWVISGYSDNLDRAAAIFDVGEEEQPSPHFEHIPTHVIVLEAKDDELEKKAALTSDDTEAFKKALKRYRYKNNGENNIFSFFDDRAIPSLICDAFESIDGMIFDFLGPKRDFGRPPEEIEAERLEAERIEKEKAEKAEKQRVEQLSEEKNKWDQGDGIHDVCVNRLEAVDEEFLAEKAKVLENYLEKEVLKHVVEGLVEVGKNMPKDPIDALAAFLFAQHRKLKHGH